MVFAIQKRLFTPFWGHATNVHKTDCRSLSGKFTVNVIAGENLIDSVSSVSRKIQQRLENPFVDYQELHNILLKALLFLESI